MSHDDIPDSDDFSDDSPAFHFGDSQEDWNSFGGSVDSSMGNLFRKLNLPSAADGGFGYHGQEPEYPEPGSTFLGFQILSQLGTGAFAHVYLAKQSELANRLVVLKVVTEITDESQTLAQMQHTNIVPIFSVHRSAPFQAVCMPYYGSATLQHLLNESHVFASVPRAGQNMLSTLGEIQHSTKVALLSLDDAFLGLKTMLSFESEEQPSKQAPAAPIQPTGSLQEKLAAMSFPELVAWIGARVADGLAHAHERGILHLDLKPANILMTDDGQPMLLDFNLSQDMKKHVDEGVQRIGGTLPYMAPEHLEAMRTRTVGMDQRADIFSLGVILYQLLTKEHPYPKHSQVDEPTVLQMIADRSQAPPDVRQLNPETPVALAAVIRKCMASRPEDRYQCASHVAEDLDRHLNNLPLKHAHEPWGKERARKWIRRHPRFTSASTVGTVAVLLVAAVAALAVARGHRLETLEANNNVAEFRDDLQEIRYLLNAPNLDEAKYQRGQELCELNLNRFEVMRSPTWANSSALTSLDEETREQVSREIGEVLYLMTRRELRLRDAQQPGGVVSAVSNDQLLHWNDLAITCYQERTPNAVIQQRVQLLNLRGETERANQLAAQVDEENLGTDDQYLLASEYLSQGRVRQAQHLLEAVVQARPTHFWAWIALGHCHDSVQNTSEAGACFSTAIAIGPKYPWPYFLRGLMRLKQKQFASARADFDRMLTLEPDSWEGRVNRALACQGLQDFAQAEADLTAALDLGAPSTRLYFMRGRVRQLQGNETGAKADIQRGLDSTPKEDIDWVARGLAQVASDPEAAVESFNQALRLNPASRSALQNKAHVQAEVLGRTEQAIDTLDQLLKLYPDFVPALGGRGILHARMGMRPEAHLDAQRCLELDQSPATYYQVAGIFALTSLQEPSDADQALRLLGYALRRGWGMDLLARDKDLDPIRNHPEFLRLQAATRALMAADNDHSNRRK